MQQFQYISITNSICTSSYFYLYFSSIVLATPICSFQDSHACIIHFKLLRITVRVCEIFFMVRQMKQMQILISKENIPDLIFSLRILTSCCSNTFIFTFGKETSIAQNNSYSREMNSN